MAEYFEAVVFRAAPATADFAQASSMRLPGAATRDEAWSRLFEALRHDRSLIGGDVQKVQ